MKKTWADIVGGEGRYSVPIGTAFLGIGAIAVGGYLDGPAGLIFGGALLTLTALTAVLETEQPLGEFLRTDRPERAGANANCSVDRSTADDDSSSLGDTRRRIEELEAERDRLQSRQEELEARLKTERRQRIGQEKLLEAVTQISRACADGNLSLRLDEDVIAEHVSNSSSILDEGSIEHELPAAFNGMLDEYESTLQDVESFVELVEQTSTTVGEQTGSVEVASEEIAERMDTIATGADKQSTRLRSAEAEMERLAENIRTIGGLVSEVASAAEQTVETGHAGQNAAEEAIDGIREIESGAGEAVEAIETLHEEMRAIDGLVESISDLAGQTNRLALNANIEASRSTSTTDSGEGFGVVATEVKELAEESQETADQIETRIQRLQKESKAATETVRDVEEKMATHAESIETALRALDDITSQAEATSKGIQQIGAATKEQATSTDEIVSLVHQTTRISEKTSELTEETRSTTIQQGQTLASVSNKSDELTRAADRLATLLGTFSIDGSSDDDDINPTSAAAKAMTENAAD
jgi:methyl-accepting chemotaxis protein